MTYIPFTRTPKPVIGDFLLLVAAAVTITVILALVLYHIFVRKKEDGRTGKISAFFNFDSYDIEKTLKITYLAAAIFITLMAASCFMICEDSLPACLMAAAVFLPGQLLLRFGYQCIFTVIETRNLNRQILEKLETMQPGEAVQKEEEKPAVRKAASKKKKR